MGATETNNLNNDMIVMCLVLDRPDPPTTGGKGNRQRAHERYYCQLKSFIQNPEFPGFRDCLRGIR